jgi:hypothetical protein
MKLFTKNELLNMKKIELQAFCVEYNIPKSGTKNILSDRILEWYRHNQPKIRIYPKFPKDLFKIIYKYCDSSCKFRLHIIFGNIFDEICSHENCKENACRMSFCIDDCIDCRVCERSTDLDDNERLHFFCNIHYKNYIECFDKYEDNIYSYFEEWGECAKNGRRFVYVLYYEMNCV